MFYGTRFYYNGLYFITAMSPAYFLFLLQISSKFHQPFNIKLLSINFNVYIWCIILLIVILLLGICLKYLLKLQYDKGSGIKVFSNRISEFANANIQDNNGSLLSFLLGNIVPAVLIMESSIQEAIIVFVALQLLIFILVQKSSDIFPNIILVILGVNICRTQKGDYLLKLKGADEEPVDIYQLGDPAKSKLYITACKK